MNFWDNLLKAFYAKSLDDYRKYYSSYDGVSSETAYWYDTAVRYMGCLKEIQAIAEKVLATNQCGRCDGIGLDECMDENCATHTLNKIVNKILEIDYD